MTREETKQLIATMVSLYPNFKPDNVSATINAWNACLETESLNDMLCALKAFVKTDKGGFAPSVGQLLGMLDSTPNVDEEWQKVRMAIRNCSWDDSREFDKLSPLAQKAVGSPEQLRIWGQMETSFVESVVSKQFKAAFTSIAERKRKETYAPEITARMNNLLADKGES